MSSIEQTDTPSTATSSSLLEGLKSPDQQGAWDRFVNRYRPVIVRYARRLGLNEDDAQDVSQQALIAFCTSYREGHYKQERGRLRHWLFGIARHHILNFRQRRPGRGEVQMPAGPGRSDFLDKIPADDGSEALWEQEWQETILRECFHIIRREFDPKTVQAFELFARDGIPAKQVAEQLQMTPNAVFLAKRRILARIRELLARMEENW